MAPPVVIHAQVAEVEWLIGWVGADEIARRIGYTSVESLRRRMRYAGRYDLSDRLGPDTFMSRIMRAQRTLAS